MLLHQIAREIQFFLTYNVNEKNHKKSGQTNFDSMHSSYLYFAFVLQLCTHVTTLHSCYNFAFMLHENALLFSPSEMHHFLLAKKLQYCVGGVFFQRHCDAVSVAGIARLLGFIN